MYWKRVKNLLPLVFSSITYRLTFFYLVSAFGILAVITGYLYFALVNNLEKEDNQFFVDKVHDLRMILREHPGNAELLQEEVNEGKDFPFVNYVRILDEKKNVLTETTDRGSSDSFNFNLKALKTDEEPVQPKKIKAPDDKVYLAMSAWAGYGAGNQEKRLIQVFLDISRENKILRDYEDKLIVLLILGVFISACMGFYIARKCMQPLQEITGVIKKIRSTNLHERVNPCRWPKELTELAYSFDRVLEHLEDSFTRLSQFSANLAHELRNPVNTLMGGAEILLSKPRTALEYQQHIELNTEEYAKLAHIIESLLFIAKAESTDIAIDRRIFDACSEIGSLIEYYDALREYSNIEITCQGAARLNADPLLFRRVISNILSNAIRYTPSGGKIIIEVGESAARCITIAIQDTGIGIEQDEISKIFDRFYRTVKAKSTSAQGTGLGLAIVKSIMDLHGGDIHIQSTPGHGTTVLLTFPSSP